MKDLLRTADLSRADVELILSTASDFAKDPLKDHTALHNRTVAIHMHKPSTRARVAYDTADDHLGGTPTFTRGSALQ